MGAVIKANHSHNGRYRDIPGLKTHPRNLKGTKAIRKLQDFLASQQPKLRQSIHVDPHSYPGVQTSDDVQPFAIAIKSLTNSIFTWGNFQDTRWLVDPKTDSIFHMDEQLDIRGGKAYNGANTRVWLSRSFQKVEVDKEYVKIHFTKKGCGRFSDRKFPKDQETKAFLKSCKNAIFSDELRKLTTTYKVEKYNTKADNAVNKIEAGVRALTALGIGGHRRMAQREFSNNRDSPVMVRLLEEITKANEKHNALN